MRVLACLVALACALACGLACGSGDQGSEPRFRAQDADRVHDAQLGLWWTARDSGRELSWRDADRHCRSLARGSHGARWRLSSIEELASLYDASAEQPCGETVLCRSDAAIDLSSPYQWSGSAPQPDRRFYFDFALGSQLAPLIRPTLTRRALCVRRDEESVP